MLDDRAVRREIAPEDGDCAVGSDGVVKGADDLLPGDAGPPAVLVASLVVAALVARGPKDDATIRSFVLMNCSSMTSFESKVCANFAQEL